MTYLSRNFGRFGAGSIKARAGEALTAVCVCLIAWLFLRFPWWPWPAECRSESLTHLERSYDAD
jgi:hypothetical protein